MDERLRGDVASEATYWDIDDVQFQCRLSRTTAWRLARTDKDFPEPVVLGQKIIVWPRVEVIAFMEARRTGEHYKRVAGESAAITNAGEPSFVSRPVHRRRGPFRPSA